MKSRQDFTLAPENIGKNGLKYQGDLYERTAQYYACYRSRYAKCVYGREHKTTELNWITQSGINISV
jgi:hypothetical protein